MNPFSQTSWKPWLRSEAGNRKWTQQRGGVFPQRSTLSVSAGCLSAFCAVILRPLKHIRVRGHLALIHTNKNSAGFRVRNFLQPVIDTSKVHESSTWKVPSQHFVVTHPPRSVRNTALFYWTTGGKQLRFMSHVAVCANILLS